MATAIIQARMGSTRLPGKVLKMLGGPLVLDWVIRSASMAKAVDRVVVATSTLPPDDAIEKHCRSIGIDCFRGSETDVLDRFYQCSKAYPDDVYLRLTGDCPFLDSDVISQVVHLRKMLNVSYCSNVDPPMWPDGLDVECFTKEALHSAWNLATRPSDRDCVTQYISRNRSTFPAANLTCPLPGLHKERWVLDTEKDEMFCQALARRVGFDSHSFTDILSALDKEPYLRDINRATRNERFYETINSEQTPRLFTASNAARIRAIKTIPFGAQTFSKSYIQYPSYRAPLYVTHADGARIFDVDGNDYIDLVSGLLPVVLGYRDPDVDEAVRRQLDRGISFSLSTEIEAELAELLCHHIPCAEMVKFGKSGTDVTTAAIRAARAYTGKDHVIACGYHGWNDWSMAETERNLGIPGAVRHLTHAHKPNEDIAIEETISRYDVAALIVEPDSCNRAQLQLLRKVCTSNGIILIFDEVISGFRVSLGGAQRLFDVTPDLATFGKAMANGMPISAVVGRKDIMRVFQPPENIFYSGTFFGETLSIAAAIATIKKIEREDVITHLWSQGNKLAAGVTDYIKKEGLESIITLKGLAPRKLLVFNGEDTEETEQIKTLFVSEMIQDGVLIINSNNISFAHKDGEIDKSLHAYKRAIDAVAKAMHDEKLAERAGEYALVAPLRKAI